MSVPALNILRRNREQRLFERLDQIWKRARFESAQDRLDFRPRQFNRIEIRRVRRQIDQVRATGLDQGNNPGDLVSRQIVHKQDVTGLEGGDDTLRDVAREDGAIDCPRQHQGGRDARRTNHRQRRGAWPRRQRGTFNDALIGCRAPVQSRQAQIDACFVQKFAVFNVQSGYGFLKFNPLLRDFQRIALTGMDRLFFNGRFSRANSRHIMLGSDLR
jgi:hypothetical protein